MYALLKLKCFLVRSKSQEVRIHEFIHFIFRKTYARLRTVVPVTLRLYETSSRAVPATFPSNLQPLVLLYGCDIDFGFVIIRRGYLFFWIFASFVISRDLKRTIHLRLYVRRCRFDADPNEQARFRRFGSVDIYYISWFTHALIES